LKFVDELFGPRCVWSEKWALVAGPGPYADTKGIVTIGQGYVANIRLVHKNP